jgi:hypothetical protein
MSEDGEVPRSARIAADVRAKPQSHNWDAVTAMVAIFIGVLALVVSGYTAYLQRQQVRAEVWPNLLIGFYNPDQAIGVHNKGVGPAIVHSVQVWVDGSPKQAWSEVFKELGIPAEGITISTISGTVISPGERVLAISMSDPADYQRFRAELVTRVNTEVCYCSTLGECWQYSDRVPGRKPGLSAIDQCPLIADNEAFLD